ncbi:Pentatricopeptide repeat-containing protein [Acorus calamus]|uniref:Pentatricopeptide repeat-containing protein n=1 Tax=Acorus calamus TaxID=4465 RepID=A0AAV9FKY6_ACOCL|nr:Pentatricopeptide repeat-containing protein [Acorus calamus]
MDNLKRPSAFFVRWDGKGMRYDCVTVSSALSACANLTALHFGKEIHGFMIKGGISSDHYSESALIDMYAKCGNVVSSRHVFDLMHGRNEVSWNSIISAYGNYGLIEDATNLLEEMEKEEFKPDHITFLAMISACSHAGLVKDGLRYFRIMTEGCKIAARMEHYACMVDLLGRAGQLNEAMSFITSMPFKPDAGIWGALLGACRVHGNVELAEIASKHLFELDPQNSGYYVLMSNINAVAGRWEGVLKVRSLMKKRRVQKLPGCSWIVINGKNHMFIAADKDHPDCAQIYSLYETLLLDLIEVGYVPQAEIVYPLLSSNRHHVCDFFVAHGYENERLECFG